MRGNHSADPERMLGTFGPHPLNPGSQATATHWDPAPALVSRCHSSLCPGTAPSWTSTFPRPQYPQQLDVSCSSSS